MKKLVSIHDVAPESLEATRGILQQVERYRSRPVTLLVLPGRDWDTRSLAQLRALEARGHALAAHGWDHRAERTPRGARPGRWRERLHSALFSGDKAEHLALDSGEILELLQRSAQWFETVGLQKPSLYVPPAWALGDLPVEQLRLSRAFETVEVFSGLLEVRTGQLTRLPLVGDAVFRCGGSVAATGVSVQAFNAWNRRRAQRLGRLRIALHPADLEGGLSPELLSDLTEDSAGVAASGGMRWAGS